MISQKCTKTVTEGLRISPTGAMHQLFRYKKWGAKHTLCPLTFRWGPGPPGPPVPTPLGVTMGRWNRESGQRGSDEAWVAINNSPHLERTSIPLTAAIYCNCVIGVDYKSCLAVAHSIFEATFKVIQIDDLLPVVHLLCTVRRISISSSVRSDVAQNPGAICESVPESAGSGPRVCSDMCHGWLWRGVCSRIPVSVSGSQLSAMLVSLCPVTQPHKQDRSVSKNAVLSLQYTILKLWLTCCGYYLPKITAKHLA